MYGLVLSFLSSNFFHRIASCLESNIFTSTNTARVPQNLIIDEYRSIIIKVHLHIQLLHAFSTWLSIYRRAYLGNQRMLYENAPQCSSNKRMVKLYVATRLKSSFFLPAVTNLEIGSEEDETVLLLMDRDAKTRQ